MRDLQYFTDTCRVRNWDEYRMWHWVLTDYMARPSNPFLTERIPIIKRALRAYTHRQPDPDTRCIWEDDYGYYILLHTLPEDITTIEGAHRYFDNHLRLTYRPTYYDCTGQHFTIRYKPFLRHGRWHIYHTIGVDC